MKQAFSGDLSDNQLLVLLPGLMACFYVVWTFSGELANLGGDSAAYVLAAKILTSFGDLSPALEAYSKGIFFPPVFPLYLGLLGGGFSLHAAHIAISVAVAVSLYLMSRFLLEEGLPRVLVLTGTALFAISPVVLFQVFNIWSEHLLLACLMLTVLLVSLYEKSETATRYWWLLSVVSLAPLVKVSGLAVVLALVVYFGARREWKRAALSVLAILPFSAWYLVNTYAPGTVSPYASHWGAQYADLSWGEISARLGSGLGAVLDSWIAGWSGANTFLYQKALAVLLSILVATGLWRDILRLRYYAIFAVIQVSMMIVWGHPEEAMRYGMVLFPFGILAGYRGLDYLLGTLNTGEQQRPAARLIALIAFCSVVLPEAGRAALLRTYPLDEEIVDARTTPGWYFLKDRRFAMLQAVSQQKIVAQLKRIRTIVPEDECVFSPKYTTLILYADRKSFAPPPESTDDKTFHQAIQSCRYFHAHAFNAFYKSSFYPLQRLEGYTVLDSAEINGTSKDRRIFAVLAVRK